MSLFLLSSPPPPRRKKGCWGCENRFFTFDLPTKEAKPVYDFLEQHSRDFPMEALCYHLRRIHERFVYEPGIKDAFKKQKEISLLPLTDESYNEQLHLNFPELWEEKEIKEHLLVHSNNPMYLIAAFHRRCLTKESGLHSFFYKKAVEMELLIQTKLVCCCMEKAFTGLIKKVDVEDDEETMKQYRVLLRNFIQNSLYLNVLNS